MEVKATVTFRNNQMIEARKAQGKNQQDMARLCGVSLHCVIALEALRYPPKLSTLAIDLLAARYGLTTEAVYPEELRGINILPTVTQIKQVPTKNLLGYRDRQISHYTLPDPIAHIQQEELRQQVKVCLKALPERDREIIILRFGFGGERPMTCKEVGKLFHLTAQGVASREASIIRRLKLLKATFPQIHEEVLEE